ncbi:MAG TPA: hypothetical protein VEH27_13330 [Methylomirabilota bacterium]|nr:hypothetical protein [Methylomirabilota bacterium]
MTTNTPAPALAGCTPGLVGSPELPSPAAGESALFVLPDFLPAATTTDASETKRADSKEAAAPTGEGVIILDGSLATAHLALLHAQLPEPLPAAPAPPREINAPEIVPCKSALKPDRKAGRMDVEDQSARDIQPDGTPAAQQQEDMSFRTDQAEFAALPEPHTPSQPERIAAADVTAPVAGVEAGATEVHGPEEAAAIEAPYTDPTRSDLLNSMREQALLIRQIGGSKVDVRIPTSDGGDLRLELTRTEALVEVTATCSDAHRNELSAHWLELKATLAQEGIILKELRSGSEAGSEDSRGGRNGNRDHRDEDPSEPDAPAATFEAALSARWQKWA